MNPILLRRRDMIRAMGLLGVGGAAGLAGCASSGAGATDTAPVVSVTSGQLRGRRAGGVISFKRVPYAANPYLPENRFLAPQPVVPWSGLREADAYGPMPPQPSRAPGGGLAGAPDELTLNIWTAGTDGARRPVMVWIPGGAFLRVDGSEAWYDGSAFARDGIVLVTLNYRVNVDGFMSVEGGVPNRAYLDQIAALQWVQRHIAAFGGDPGNVTLFGQSAGAQSVMALLGMPQSKGLFQRAIAQSPPIKYHQPADAQRVARATAELLKVAPTRAAMSGVPLPALIAAVEAMNNDLRDLAKWGAIGDQPPYLPVIDGVVLTQPPLAALRAHAPPGLPLLIGCNDDESRLYLVPSGAIERIPEPAVAGFARRAGLAPEAVEAWRRQRPAATPGDVFAALSSDAVFRMPTLRYTENRVRAGAPVWAYQFAWRSPAFGGKLGAAHVVDVPFVFDTLDSDGNAKTFTAGAGPRALAVSMHTSWVRFAKAGDPGWPPYNLATRPTMRFDTVSAVVNDPGAADRELWSGITFE